MMKIRVNRTVEFGVGQTASLGCADNGRDFVVAVEKAGWLKRRLLLKVWGPEPPPVQPPYNVYAVQFRGEAGGGSMKIYADSFDREDGKLAFYHGEFFVADMDDADVLTVMVEQRVGKEPR